MVVLGNYQKGNGLLRRFLSHLVLMCTVVPHKLHGLLVPEPIACLRPVYLKFLPNALRGATEPSDKIFRLMDNTLLL